jgi:protein HIRA/HIR1
VVKRLIGHQSGTVWFHAAAWRCLLLLDTVGVEWSPDGGLLASCGLDGTIFIWNAAPSSAQTVFARLEHAHGGFIKGLAWDPAGQYLASQSDDGICNIWNVKSILEAVRSNASSSVSFDCSEEQECEAIKVVALEDVFHHASKMTFFHRPSWSPDGAMLALANASNRQIPVVALIERANWKGGGMSFVGHDAPIEVVRFCPRFMRLAPASSNQDFEGERNEVICAVAGQDGQLSVWTSCQTAPLLVINDAFDHTVMDLAWSPNGRVLIAASYDGSIVGVSFGEVQLEEGKALVPLADELQKTRLQDALSGLQARAVEGSTSASGYLHHQAIISQVKENDMFLVNQATSIEGSLGDSIKEEPARPMRVQAAEPVLQPTAPQSPIVSVTKDGRKRITPQLLTQAPLMPQAQASSLESGQEAASMKPRMQSAVWQRWREEDYIAQRRFLDKASALLAPHLLSGSLFNLKELGDAEPATLVHHLAKGGGALAMLPDISVQISNANVGDRKASAVVSLIEGNQVAWKERCRGTVYLVSGHLEYSVLAVKGGESRHGLMFLSRTGRRILPLIALASRALRFVVRGEFCLVLTVCGSVHLWYASRLSLCNGSALRFLPLGM